MTKILSSKPLLSALVVAHVAAFGFTLSLAHNTVRGMIGKTHRSNVGYRSSAPLPGAFSVCSMPVSTPTLAGHIPQASSGSPRVPRKVPRSKCSVHDDQCHWPCFLNRLLTSVPELGEHRWAF